MRRVSGVWAHSGRHGPLRAQVSVQRHRGQQLWPHRIVAAEEAQLGAVCEQPVVAVAGEAHRLARHGGGRPGGGVQAPRLRQVVVLQAQPVALQAHVDAALAVSAGTVGADDGLAIDGQAQRRVVRGIGREHAAGTRVEFRDTHFLLGPFRRGLLPIHTHLHAAVGGPVGTVLVGLGQRLVGAARVGLVRAIRQAQLAGQVVAHLVGARQSQRVVVGEARAQFGLDALDVGVADDLEAQPLATTHLGHDGIQARLVFGLQQVFAGIEMRPVRFLARLHLARDGADGLLALFLQAARIAQDHGELGQLALAGGGQVIAAADLDGSWVGLAAVAEATAGIGMAVGVGRGGRQANHQAGGGRGACQRCASEVGTGHAVGAMRVRRQGRHDGLLHQRFSKAGMRSTSMSRLNKALPWTCPCAFQRSSNVDFRAAMRASPSSAASSGAGW